MYMNMHIPTPFGSFTFVMFACSYVVGGITLLMHKLWADFDNIYVSIANN